MNKQFARRGVTAVLVAAAISVAGGFSLVPQAKADVIHINTCWSRCNGLTNVTMTTLDVSQGGANSVNFTLTNLVGNLATATSTSFLSELYHTYTGSSQLTFTKTDFSAVGGAGTFSTGTFSNASLNFNLLLGMLV